MLRCIHFCAILLPFLSFVVTSSSQIHKRGNRPRNTVTKRPRNVDLYAAAERSPFQTEESNQWKPILHLPPVNPQGFYKPLKYRQPPKNSQHIVFTTEKNSSPIPHYSSLNYVSNSSIIVDDFGAPIKTFPTHNKKRKFQQSNNPKKNLDQYEVHEYVNEESRYDQKYQYQGIPQSTSGRNIKPAGGEKHIHHVHYHDSEGWLINGRPSRGSRLGAMRPH